MDRDERKSGSWKPGPDYLWGSLGGLGKHDVVITGIFVASFHLGLEKRRFYGAGEGGEGSESADVNRGNARVSNSMGTKSLGESRVE